MWNEGYTSEVEYTSGYYLELSPERIKLSLLAAGIDHAIARAPEYLELGFGQGLSLAIHAATNSGQYWGNDFNPAQVANARDFAAASGKPVAVLEHSFEELARRDDLPEFDIIALHGIWSWVSDGARASIIEIARKNLRPGGALYISYNVLPGWAPLIPMRTMMHEYGRREAHGEIIDRVEAARGYLTRLAEAQADYFDNNPKAKVHLENLKKHDNRYLAHEYFNDEWHVTPFVTVADQLAEAKLTFATSATILETLPGISVSPAATEVLDTIKDPLMREQTRDFFVNQMFRRDLFVKGARRLSPGESARRIDQSKFVLVGNPEKQPTKVKCAVGEAELKPEVYGPLIAALIDRPQHTASVAQLVDACEGLNRSQVWEAMQLLTGMAYVSPVSTSATAEADAAAAKALNKHLFQLAANGAGVDFIAAPKIGGGINVSKIEQMFIRAIRSGEKDPVEAVRKMLAGLNQLLVVEGETISDEAATREELTRILAKFQSHKEAQLKLLGAI